MELIYFDDYLKESNSNIVATIGDFDGFHIAHQFLIKEVEKASELHELKSAIITFEPHPRLLFNKDFSILSTFEDKMLLLSDYKIDYFIVIPFNNEVACLSPELFVKNYLMKLRIKYLVTGFDFRFGLNHVGSCSQISLLSNNTISTIIVDKIAINDQKISSSNIRSLLELGKIEEANKLLGHYFLFHGEVVHGKQIGRKLHIPTANLKIDDNYIKIKNGVYAVIVFVNNKYYRGIMNVGHNPSFNFSKKISIEINIFDFNENIYYNKVFIYCCSYFREEMNFKSIEDFKNQIENDKDRTYRLITSDTLEKFKPITCIN